MSELRRFKTLIHLAGEQVLPLCLGAKQVEAERHLIVASEKTKFVADRLALFLGGQDTILDPVLLENPFDPLEINQRLANHEALRDGDTVINATGGTKPMFIGAYSYGIAKKIPSFYIETYPVRKLIWLDPGNLRDEPLKPAFTSVKQLIEAASGRPIIGESPLGWIGKRRSITELLWQNRHAMGVFYKQLQGIDEQHFGGNLGKGPQDRPHHFHVEAFGGILQVEQNPDGGKISFQKGDEEIVAEGEWNDPFAYLMGVWLEDLVADRIYRTQGSGVVDLRYGLKLAFPEHGKMREDKQLAQDLDVVATDGYELVVIECKSGGLSQEVFQKAENVVSATGGSFASGILVSSRWIIYPNTPEYSRITNSRNLRAYCGTAIIDQMPNELFCQPPGTIHIGSRFQ